jgi:RNA-directed DNA polymerase
VKSIGRIFETVTSVETLCASARAAAKGKKDRKPVTRFLANLDRETERLSAELRSGTYTPGVYSQFRIMDPKPRLISCADFRDRVVHHALCDVTGPMIETRFIERSFACRKNKGFHRAIHCAQKLSRRHRYYLKLDIRSFYNTVDLEIAHLLLVRLFRETKMQHLWEKMLWHPFPGQIPGKGLPIGNLTSQWIANLYLDGLDHRVTERYETPAYIRYMDDFLLFHDSKTHLWNTMERISDWLLQHRKLTLKQSSICLAPCNEGVPFLRMRVFPGMIRLSRDKLRRSRRLAQTRCKQLGNHDISPSEYVRSIKAIAGITRVWNIKNVVSSDLDL